MYSVRSKIICIRYRSPAFNLMHASDSPQNVSVLSNITGTNLNIKLGSLKDKLEHSEIEGWNQRDYMG